MWLISVWSLNSFGRVRFCLTTLIYFQLQCSLSLLCFLVQDLRLEFLNLKIMWGWHYLCFNLCCLKAILIQFVWKQNIQETVLTYLILSLNIRGNLLSNLPLFLGYPGAFCKNNCYFSFGILRTSIIYPSTYHLFIFYIFTLFSIYSSISWLCTSLICTLKRIQIFANCIFCLIITNFISEILLLSSVVSNLICFKLNLLGHIS